MDSNNCEAAFGEITVMFVIASTRPLPIHYERDTQWYFKRGIHAAPEVYYPFFVEIERGEQLEPLFAYIARFIRQYTQYELAVHVHDWAVAFALQQCFRHATFERGVVVLKKCA